MGLIRKLAECEDCRRRRERLMKMSALMKSRFDQILGRHQDSTPSPAQVEEPAELPDSWVDHVEDVPHQGVEYVDTQPEQEEDTSDDQ